MTEISVSHHSQSSFVMISTARTLNEAGFYMKLLIGKTFYHMILMPYKILKLVNNLETRYSN